MFRENDRKQTLFDVTMFPRYVILAAGAGLALFLAI